MPDNKNPQEDFSFKSTFVPLTTKKAIHFIIIIGLLLFFLGLFNNFVGDDNTQIIDNPSIQSIQNLPAFFFENRLDTGGKTKLGGEYFKPLLDTSYALTYSLFGSSFFAYHFIQLIFYLTNACLVFFLFKYFFTIRISFLLALIFLVHPINSETALYIADTQDVLLFFFGLLALSLLRKYHSPRALIVVSICLFLSLLSKETGFLFLFILPLYAYLFKRKVFKPLLGYSSIIVLIYAFLRIHAIGFFPHPVINAPIERLDLAQRLINMPAMLFFYLKTFLFPFALSNSWQWAYTHIDIYHFFIPLLLDVLFIASIVFIATILYKKHSRKLFILYLFFSVWFLLGILFHMQILPLDQTVADRWFYFPIVGVLGMIGIIFEMFHINIGNKWIFIIIATIVILLSLRTFVRTFDFRDDFTLASHDIHVAPDSYNLEYIISHTYYDEGKFQEAKLHAQRSIELFPYITNYTNLGAIDSSMGDYRGAREAYMKALAYGDDSLPYENLASLSLVYGNPKQSIDFISNIALKKYPADGMLWFDLAVLEYQYSNKASAKLDIEQAKLSIKNPNVAFIEYIINNKKPLKIKVTNGNVIFYTY